MGFCYFRHLWNQWIAVILRFAVLFYGFEAFLRPLHFARVRGKVGFTMVSEGFSSYAMVPVVILRTNLRITCGEP